MKDAQFIPGGCLFVSNFLILFALIGVIRGQFQDSGFRINGGKMGTRPVPVAPS
jgi:hypothetical protein